MYVVRGGPIAYKQVAHVSDAQAQILRHEYDILQEIYLKCNTDSFFATPRAFAYNDPDQNSGGFVSSLPSLSSSARRHLAHPIVTPNIMAPFTRATYAMDRVHALPYNAGMIISKKYLPESLRRIQSLSADSISARITPTLLLRNSLTLPTSRSMSNVILTYSKAFQSSWTGQRGGEWDGRDAF